jgi:hypothetical protein
MSGVKTLLVALLCLPFCNTECSIAADKKTTASASSSSVSASAASSSQNAASLTAPMPSHMRLSSTYGSHLLPILAAINATPEQRKQIGQIVEDFRPKIQPLKVKYKETQTEFLQAMISARAPEELMLKQGELTELYGRIVNEYCVMNLHIRKLLKPAQCQKYEEYRAKQGWSSRG